MALNEQPGEIDRVIEMAWEDRTPFEAIETLYGLRQDDVIALMRRELKPRSFKVWRERTNGRKTKHKALRSASVGRSHCKSQYKVKSSNGKANRR
ncbi:TIGR03643 family protein [Salinivibrio costicola]|uniref:TIGR03643 family protein n=1 Tax=Salinivibrio costicola TaxID=51367 RepID=A0ABX6K7V8_SALCS|nr:TIGR03643 family protein [Salinivibrio costicola]QIR06216.1 TIGR03643 family protein [Salinivibrio costicola]